jgi:hypothetical protein
MILRPAILGTLFAAFLATGCGDDDIIDGFGTFGSASIQGFVLRPDGSPVAGINVFADFGPNAFALGVQTDARGLYELRADSHQPLADAPFSDGVIQTRISVGQGLADTLLAIRFAPEGQRRRQ